ncbi:hypothetical protein MNV49_002276 [Pseudohyphozyma bogoriensis]|nr:hypothetical protein MNV49_002276 [Pseudohyphozyma bogoriensis]
MSTCSGLRKKTVGKRKPGVVLKSLSPTSTGSKLASEELGFALSFHLVSLAAEPPSVDLEFCANHPCYRQVVRAIHAQSVLLLADPTLPDEQREFISEFARGNIMYDAHQSANRGAAAALTPFEQKTYGHTTLAYKLMVQKTHGWVEQNYLAEQVELENVSEVVGVAVLSRTGTLGVVGGLDGLDFDSVQQDFHFDFSAVDILSHYYFHTLSSFLDSSNPSSFRVPPDALSAMQELHAGASVLPFLLNLHLAAAARRLWTLAGPEGDPRWTRLKVVTEARFTRAFGEFLVFLETPMYQASATGVHTLGLLLENLKALPGWIDVLVDAVLSQSSDFSPEQAERVRHLLAVAGDAFYTVGQWEKELRTKLEAVEVTSQIVELALEDIDRI